MALTEIDSAIAQPTWTLEGYGTQGPEPFWGAPVSRDLRRIGAFVDRHFNTISGGIGGYVISQANSEESLSELITDPDFLLYAGKVQLASFVCAAAYRLASNAVKTYRAHH